MASKAILTASKQTPMVSKEIPTQTKVIPTEINLRHNLRTAADRSHNLKEAVTMLEMRSKEEAEAMVSKSKHRTRITY